MTDVERRYHETWLGMVQPIEGLVFSVPVLVDAGVMDRSPPETQERFRAHLVEVKGENGASLRVRDLKKLLQDLLGFDDADLAAGDALPAELSVYVPEGQQRLAPTLAVQRRESASDAPLPQRFELLVWEVPDGLDLDRAETATGPWEYPPQHKLDRLLRGTEIPVGVLTNGEALRLVYAPRGESTGALTFNVADMASVGGRPILDAFLSLFSASRCYAGAADRTLGALLAESRKRQANVTNDLAAQVFEAVDTLLHGFEAAAERDGTSALREAMEADEKHPGEHVYGGLLTTMLRLVFLLYAEDRGLMPMAHPVYARHLSVLGLFEQLQQDAGTNPDTMGRRFGAWSRLLVLFRAVFEGARWDGLHMPARRGRLFDPNGYPFLEGWTQGGSAPHDVESRGAVRVPSIDDETVYRVLDKLILLDGQRLSYRALDVEQIGSVYEALMGYRVQRLVSPAVCLKGTGAWLEAERVLAEAGNRREALVVEESGLSKGQVGKIGDALKKAKDAEGVADALVPLAKKGVPTRQPGALVLQPGAERRRTSSHYTPPSLSTPIVEKTLKPLIATMGGAPTADRLLELKVCDPAMGSGAFLVAACKFLADEVQKAWTRDKQIHDIEKEHGDALTHARRLVAQRCLYGVDKNPYAVTLAKLSLWLVSLAKDEPFTFVDHALRHGDSLVGLSLEQLRTFHWDPSSRKHPDFIVEAVTKDLDDSMVHRQRILQLARSHDEASAREKEQLLREADDYARNARLLGDVVIGAFFAHEKDREREKELNKRLTAAQQWLQSKGAPADDLLHWQREIHDVAPPFHWPIEFPEVFYAGRPDPLDAERPNRVAWMDGFVGNPPFLGGMQISSRLGAAYQRWLLAVQESPNGNADLCAHFLRRGFALLGSRGAMGFITTDMISQGDTREFGLQWLIEHGGDLYAARSTATWPGAAAVNFSTVSIAKDMPAFAVLPRELDGNAVERISTQLRQEVERPDPATLKSNVGKAVLGVTLHGEGFVVGASEARTLLAVEPKNKECLLPYVGGSQVTSEPAHEPFEWVINFGDRTLDEARRWPALLAIVEERVRPGRLRLRDDNPAARARKERWWRFAGTASDLHERLRGMKRCICAAQIAKDLYFNFLPTGRTFDKKVVVVADERASVFAALQSRVHVNWAWRYSSSRRDAGIQYNASRCFDTFPLPPNELLALGGDIDVAGEVLCATRAKYMVDAQQGLTSTYNQLKDPSCTEPRVVELRELHEQIDRAVLDAYGWSDVKVPPYCPTTDAERKAVGAFEGEVVDRLFDLNAKRAKEEELLGLGGGTGSKKGKVTEHGGSTVNPEASGAAKRKAARKKKEPAGQGGLF